MKIIQKLIQKQWKMTFQIVRKSIVFSIISYKTNRKSMEMVCPSNWNNWKKTPPSLAPRHPANPEVQIRHLSLDLYETHLTSHMYWCHPDRCHPDRAWMVSLKLGKPPSSLKEVGEIVTSQTETFVFRFVLRHILSLDLYWDISHSRWGGPIPSEGEWSWH